MKNIETNTSDNSIHLTTKGYQWDINIIGYYELSYIKVGFKEKPNFIKRFLMKHLLGFTWHDITN